MSQTFGLCCEQYFDLWIEFLTLKEVVQFFFHKLGCASCDFKAAVARPHVSQSLTQRKAGHCAPSQRSRIKGASVAVAGDMDSWMDKLLLLASCYVTQIAGDYIADIR